MDRDSIPLFNISSFNIKPFHFICIYFELSTIKLSPRNIVCQSSPPTNPCFLSQLSLCLRAEIRRPTELPDLGSLLTTLLSPVSTPILSSSTSFPYVRNLDAFTRPSLSFFYCTRWDKNCSMTKTNSLRVCTTICTLRHAAVFRLSVPVEFHFFRLVESE